MIGESVLSLSRRCNRQVGSTNPSASRTGFGLINERAHLPCALVLRCCSIVTWTASRRVGHGRGRSLWNGDDQTARESSELVQRRRTMQHPSRIKERMPGRQARQSQVQRLTTWSLARACGLTICTAADPGSQHDGFLEPVFPSIPAALACNAVDGRRAVLDTKGRRAATPPSLAQELT